MSANERADNELYELIRNGLARCYPHSKSDGLLSWGLTDVGRTVAQRIKRRALGRGSFPAGCGIRPKRAPDCRQPEFFHSWADKVDNPVEDVDA
jgi:hypothetical protein